MTVVLAIRCSDGLVLAADTQVTEGDRGMSYPAQKLHTLGPHASWGGSGARSVLLELEEVFEESSGAIVDAENVGRALQERTLPVLRHHYDHYIDEVPGEGSTAGPSTYVLAAGYSGDDPWIFEINPNGMVNRYDDIGFHAIGSGAPMAHQAGALLAHFNMTERPLAYGVVAAVRVLRALAITSPSVGGEFDVSRITPEGAEHLDDDELDQVHEQVERWTELEQQAMDRLFE